MLPSLYVPLVILLSWVSVSCNSTNGNVLSSSNDYKKGQLTARPKDGAASAFKTGVQPLGLTVKRDGFIYVPEAYKKDKPAALAVMLHGAGGVAEHGLGLFRRYADDKNIIILATASREATWDILMKNTFDEDVRLLDEALNKVFETYNINAGRIAIGGFSDGASYALSIGLSNGDLFTHVIAFSPGFYHTIENKGKPAVFISHGVTDKVLPINPCSRRIVSQLKQEDYKVQYHEFQGGHQVPGNISANAANWFK